MYTPGNVLGMFNLGHTAMHQIAKYVWHDVNHCDVVVKLVQ